MILLYFLFLHWLGDFVIQTRWMADNKSRKWEALCLHVFVYCFIVTVGVGATMLFRYDNLCRFAMINFIAHLVVDSITSWASKMALALDKTHWFFAIVGADQFAHAATIIITAELLLGKVW